MKEKNNILVAITGNLCSGKSFLLETIKEMGYSVFSFDNETASLLATDNQVISNIQNHFPSAIREGKIDKKILGDIVFSNSGFLKILEEILMPDLYKRREEFIKNLENKTIAFFEVPLLFEKGTELMYDYVILLTVPKNIQEERIRKRKISNEKARKIIKLQASPIEVKYKANYVIDTSADLSNIKDEIKTIIKMLESGF
jgi:dephospho-CoA kinase